MSNELLVTEPPHTPPHDQGVGHFAMGSVNWTLRQRAFAAYAGAFVVWIAAWLLAGHGLVGTLSSGITVGTFLLITGIGQMFVITSGNGGIDLSVPYVLTWSAYVSATLMNGQNKNLLLGLGGAILVGLAAGTANALLIQLLTMPPIIATLAVGFVIESAYLSMSSTGNVLPSPNLVSFTTGYVGPIPTLIVLGIGVTVVFTLVLTRTPYGREVCAIGQNIVAARLAGVHCQRVAAMAYIICALGAAMTGFLLGAYGGGPSLDIGGTYQLGSIAVVVLGGSLIAGGKANVPGIWASALLLTLLITLVNVAHVSSGMEDIVEGALIIAVLMLGNATRERA